MAKYFMGGTRLEGLERLMMDSSRSEHFPAPDVCREKGRCPKNGSRISVSTLSRAEASLRT